METLCDDNEIKVYRFNCRCWEKDHAIDIVFEVEDGLYIDMDRSWVGWKSLKQRVKDIWAILRGKEVQVDTFIFREEDYRAIASIFTELADRQTEGVNW